MRTKAYNSLIQGYKVSANLELALKTFDLMIKSKVFPDAITFSNMIELCGVCNRIDLVDVLTEKMKNDFMMPFDQKLLRSTLLAYTSCREYGKILSLLEKFKIALVPDYDTAKKVLNKLQKTVEDQEVKLSIEKVYASFTKPPRFVQLSPKDQENFISILSQLVPSITLVEGKI